MVATALVGCLGAKPAGYCPRCVPATEPPVLLTIKDIQIYYAPGGPGTLAQGFHGYLQTCVTLLSESSGDMAVQTGIEVFTRIGDAQEPASRHDYEDARWHPGYYLILDHTHWIHATNATPDYSVRLWQRAENSFGVVEDSKWYNMTVIPGVLTQFEGSRFVCTQP